MTIISRKKLCSVTIAMLLASMPFAAFAANNKTTVGQVTSSVALTDDVDYIVDAATPFSADGKVNIQNTDHAVLILSKVKPSKAIALLADHVQINGAKAVNNSNCQVKLYNRGCIVLPYGNSVKPLTVFSEQYFGGESCNDFGLENSGGFMNTLSDKKLNNRIRSFKLKRGYMVTFANRAGGRGYSRCFIAADSDLEIAQLPGVLDNSISSYRIFKWYDTGKQALANDTRTETVNALNVTSCYSFGLGENKLPDAECVPHHIYEDWPSASACGTVTYSPHLKTNNEPGNSADDHPQSVEEILNNWENLMRTGMRLCSPSSHDGSLNHLRQFLNAIDERGWRCDIIDLHCYWPEWNFYNSIKGWVDSYHRPIWISEWVWGASWNNNGIFGEAQGDNRKNPTQAQLQKNREIVQNICNALNSYDYIERYYYWNSEANCSKLYYDGKLTPAGEMYANLDGGLAYNGKYDYAPNVPVQKDPGDLVVEFDKKTQKATLTWQEYNGELNTTMQVERRPGEGQSWTTIATIEQKEEAAQYTFEDSEATNGCQYRVHIVDAHGKDRYTKQVMAASDDLQAGDAVNVDGQTKYIGGNIILNGDFDMGLWSWTNGEGKPLAQPWFQAVSAGGADGSFYLQSYGTGNIDSEQSVKTLFEIEPQCDYYLSGASCNTTSVFTQFNYSVDGEKIVTTPVLLSLNNTTNNWLTQFKTFNSGEYSKVLASFRTMGAKTQVDQLMLCRLYDSQEEAIADGIDKARKKAQAFAEFNTLYPEFNEDLTRQLQSIQGTTSEDLAKTEKVVGQTIAAYYNYPRLKQLIDYAEKLTAFELYDVEILTEVLEKAKAAVTAAEVNECYGSLRDAVNSYLPMTPVNGKIQNPSFASENGWTTKCGTFTGGDQRLNSKDEVTFWNAWWGGLSSTEGEAKTMEIKQEVTGLGHGLYSLQCRASTEHYCLSDQHGYLTDGTQTETTPNLSADFFDITTVTEDQRWEKLLTAPIYVPEGGSLTLGFTGSKQGAQDNAWVRLGDTNDKKTGDKREGWWCATEFVLQKTPLYRLTVTPEQWGVVCLPYAVRPTQDQKFYQIAGITDDFTQLCLEEIPESEPGLAFIFKSKVADAVFLEYGLPVAKAGGDAPGNLRSFFSSTSSVPMNYFYLEEGQWVKVTDSSNRPKLGNFTGILRPVTDRYATPLTIYSQWEGETMPIIGVTQEEMDVMGIVPLTTVQQHLKDGLYTIGGQTVDSDRLQRGIYIKIENGRARKIIK